MTEVARKLLKLREALDANAMSAVHLRSVDWFSWATAGGTSVVILTNEIGVAEILVTKKAAFVLTNRIERDRLAQEEVPEGFELVSFPWEDTKAKDEFVRQASGSGKICSDRPQGTEAALPWAILQLKLQLEPEELVRYRTLGRGAAEAMTAALKQAEPSWTEQELAGAGAKELWSRGFDPTLVMVGGEKRVQSYRHPIAKDASLGDFAMMVFCARGFGLYANLTRFVFFKEPTSAEKEKFVHLANIEASAFKASVQKQSLRNVYSALKSTYESHGYRDEIGKHHQGGPTGYLSREFIAGPESDEKLKVMDRMALAWNPSLPGAKIEDTIFVNGDSIEVLTVDPAWPTFENSGVKRPDVWVKK